MKFSCGLTAEEKKRLEIEKMERICVALQKWHRWFAWRPVTVSVIDGRRTCAWLCYVERRLPFVYVRSCLDGTLTYGHTRAHYRSITE